MRLGTKYVIVNLSFRKRKSLQNYTPTEYDDVKLLLELKRNLKISER